MVKNSKGKNRLDKFYRLAKEQGFRSRAAFKLIQLNKKYAFFNDCNSVLDLCAAPGGWMQVAAKYMPVSRLIVGVDLIPIRPIRGTVGIVADITTEKCSKLIEQETTGRLFDVILHDGSPNVGGAWHSESLSQAILVLDALKLATQFLAPRGWFITKVFRSKDYNALMYVCHQLFRKVEATKPMASRDASAEIFLVCQGYKAPAQIDPKLLDSRFLMEEYNTTSKMHGPLAMQKRQGKKMHRRFREGYEEGASTTFKTTSVMTFIKAGDPVEALGLYTQFTFEAESLIETATDEEKERAQIEYRLIEQHAKTTDEIRESCRDLLILGKKEFKKLLKWQVTAAKALKASQTVEMKKENKEAEIDPEAFMMKEMTAIQERIEHKAKKREKKRRKMKKMARKRMAQFKQTEGMVEDSIIDPDLFSLDMFTEREQIERHRNTETDPLEDGNRSESSEAESDTDDDDEMKYEAMLEEYLERSYQRFLKRKGDETDLDDPILKRRKRLEQSGELSGEEEEEGVEMESVGEEETETKGGGLLVELDKIRAGVATTAEAVSSQWFSQDIFQDDDIQIVDDTPVAAAPTNLPPKPANEKEPSEEDTSDFEVVRPEKPDGTDTEDEFRMLDVDGKAEIIAMARKMLHRKEKENIIDAAYSRYVFHDRDLPKWFEHDNDIYNRPQRMVTRAEIEAEKEMLRAMDSRPIKKVAEAKARKAKRLSNRLQSAMKRAEGIANQDELSHGTRMRQIAKTMKTARRRENGKFIPKDQLKRMGRTKQFRASKKLPPIDRRQRSDKRVTGMGRGGKNLKRMRERRHTDRNKRALRKHAS